MKRKLVRNSVKMLNINLLKLFFIKLAIIILVVLLTENVHAQGCSVTLKVNDPAPVCSPSTVDLTSDAITAGSTEGLKFSYYVDEELTVLVSSPTQVNAGLYYIKGMLTGSCAGFVAASVKATVIKKPKLIIANPVVISANENVNLTLPQITSGSDEGLIFSYWYDAEAKQSLPTPWSTGKGKYFIKGTSDTGCFDIQLITIND